MLDTALEKFDAMAGRYMPPERKLSSDDYTDFAGTADDQDFAEATKKPLGIHALDVHELAAMHFKQRDVILSPWLHSQDLCMVFAARGIGKTHFALSIAFAVATGGTFAKWTAPTPRTDNLTSTPLTSPMSRQKPQMNQCQSVRHEEF